MFKDFKQFVPSSVCLKCDGCCRFKEHDSRWRPYISQREKKGIAEKILRPQLIDENGKIITTACAQGFLCHFFNNKDNTCGIYHARPFECQLYPFVLGKENDRAVLYVHLNCPYVQEYFGTKVYIEYTEYLRGYFKTENVRRYLSQNPKILADYSSSRAELDLICELALE